MTVQTRVLLTGATGLVGRAVVAHLLARGLTVHSLGRSSLPGVVHHAADLLSPQPWEATVAQIEPTHLLHLAWTVEHGKFWTTPENLPWVGASLRLFQAAAAAGCRRIVGVGTCAEYDWSSDRMDEAATPLNPATLYGTAKRATADLLARWGEGAGVSTAWARLFFLYGAGEAPGRFVPSVIRGLLAGDIARCSHGGQIRDFLAVEDAGAGLVAALLTPDLTGPFNLASGHGVSLRSVAEKIAALMGRGPEALAFAPRPDPDPEPPSLVGPPEKLSRLTGWHPETDLEAGLRRTIGWWREQAA